MRCVELHVVCRACVRWSVAALVLYMCPPPPDTQTHNLTTRLARRAHPCHASRCFRGQDHGGGSFVHEAATCGREEKQEPPQWKTRAATLDRKPWSIGHQTCAQHAAHTHTKGSNGSLSSARGHRSRAAWPTTTPMAPHEHCRQSGDQSFYLARLQAMAERHAPDQTSERTPGGFACCDLVLVVFLALGRMTVARVWEARPSQSGERESVRLYKGSRCTEG